MTSQSSTSGLSSPSMGNICKETKTSEEKTERSENESNESITVFTKQEELKILNEIKKDKQSICICICKLCLMNKLIKKIYRRTEENKLYPKDCNNDSQLISKAGWLRNYEERHKDKISKLPLNCKASSLPHSSMSNPIECFQPEILTFEQEHFYFTQLQKTEIRRSCICRTCIMLEVPSKAYITAHDLKKCYPKSWDTDMEAEMEWTTEFLQRNIHEISKLPSYCNTELYQEGKFTHLFIFTPDDETSLLTQLQQIETQHGCKCENCLLKELPALAYKMACNLHKDYPETWYRDKQAGRMWLKCFKGRHQVEISKFSSDCNREIPQTSISRRERLPVFTDENEEHLLTQLQQIETQHGCKCENCLLKELPALAYKMACDLHKDFPETWYRDKQAGQMWLKCFKERHQVEISKFSSDCNREILPQT